MYASKKVYVDVVFPFQCMLVHVPLWRSVYARLRGCASPVYASVSGCSSPVYASVSGCSSPVYASVSGCSSPVYA